MRRALFALRNLYSIRTTKYFQSVLLRFLLLYAPFHLHSKSFFTILALFVFRLIYPFIHVIIISSGISREKLNIACIRGVSRETLNYQKKKKKNYKSRNKLPMIIRGRSIDLGGIYKYSRQRAEMAARAMTTNRLNGY